MRADLTQWDILCQIHLFGKYRLSDGMQWNLKVSTEMGELRSIQYFRRSSLILDVGLHIPTHLLSLSPGLNIMLTLEESSQFKTLVRLTHVELLLQFFSAFQHRTGGRVGQGHQHTYPLVNLDL